MCTALQIALVDLLNSWGIYPNSVTGHSSGEIAAAYATGALSMQDAISVAYYRGVVASQMLDDDQHKGAMMAVGISVEEIQPYMDQFPSKQLVIACVNSPSSVTISGDVLAIGALAHMLEAQPVFCRRLEVGVAYHSPHAEQVAEHYCSLINHIQPRNHEIVEDSKESSTAFFSSVTGTRALLHELGSQYWVSNLVGQVKFAQSLKRLCFDTDGHRAGQTGPARARRTRAAQKPSVDCLIEIGPHSALAGPIKQIIQSDAKLNAADIAYISILKRSSNAVTTALGAMATLASLNYPIKFSAINKPEGIGNNRKPQLLMDLPTYPWNHTRPYWAEPRLSKMYRNRSSPRIDLLGAPDNMASPFEPRWRNYLRTSELPWLLDHKIQGNIVFPAAGYLVMAMKASLQLNNSEEIIARYILQDVIIHSALVLDETSPVELMVSLRKSTQEQECLYNFHIYSISEDNRWIEHCTGLVGTQKRVGNSSDGSEETEGYAMVPLGTEVYGISEINVLQFYEKLRSLGLEYGPCFANMTKARVTQDGACYAEVTIPDTISVMPTSFQYDFLIHPCTLDSMFHTIFAALPSGMGIEEGPAIPVFLEEMIVSSSLNFSPGELISICTHMRPVSKKNVTACIVVTNYHEKKLEAEPGLSIRGLRCTRLERHEMASKIEDSRTIYHIDWKPDLSFVSSSHASYLFEKRGNFQQGLILQTQYEKTAAGFIRAALEEVNTTEARKLDYHHRRFRCYLQEVLERHDDTSPPSVSHLEDIHPVPIATGGLLDVIGQNLAAIIRDQIDFSAVMKDDRLLDEFWDIFSADISYQLAASYVNLIGHKKPDISILEFGVGTGQIAKIFLDNLLSLDGAPHCGKYTFAHESTAVLEDTLKRLEAWSEWIDCKPLDFGKSFPKQGFEEHSFDVIILPHGLCTARCEQNALNKIHDLLSPSGYLIAINPFDPKENVLKNLLFSALHCLSADEFCLGQGGWTKSQWVEILQGAQFTEVDTFAERDSEKSHQFIVAKSRKIQALTGRFSIICEDEAGIARNLVAELQKISCDVTVTHVEDVECKDRVCLVLDTSQTSILSAPSERTFNKIKAMLTHSGGVLWITCGGTIEPTNPNAGLVLGFARTARAESGVKPIVTFDLDARNPLSDSHAAKVIASLLATRFSRGCPDEDMEYAERNGNILIPRVVESLHASKIMDGIDHTEILSKQPFHLLEQPLRLSRKVDSPGFVSDSRMSELPFGYVGITVHCFSLNEWDIHSEKIGWDTEDTIGMECSGIVYKIGPGVHRLNIGDRVACLGAGTARSFYHDRESVFQRIDDDMSFEVASAIPLAFTIAGYVVDHLSLVESNDAILVHDGGSHFGQAIVETYLLKNARVFATVQNSTQKELLGTRFGIPTERVFIDGQDDVVKGMSRLTDGKKANIVVTFETAQDRKLQNCTAPFGRFIHLRTNNLRAPELSCPQNTSLSTFNIFELQKDRCDLIDQIWSKVSYLFHEGRLTGPVSTDVYHVSLIQEAIAAMSTGQYVVISAQSNNLVMVQLIYLPQRRLVPS